MGESFFPIVWPSMWLWRGRPTRASVNAARRSLPTAIGVGTIFSRFSLAFAQNVPCAVCCRTIFFSLAFCTYITMIDVRSVRHHRNRGHITDKLCETVKWTSALLKSSVWWEPGSVLIVRRWRDCDGVPCLSHSPATPCTLHTNESYTRFFYALHSLRRPAVRRTDNVQIRGKNKQFRLIEFMVIANVYTLIMDMCSRELWWAQPEIRRVCVILMLVLCYSQRFFRTFRSLLPLIRENIINDKSGNAQQQKCHRAHGAPYRGE